MRWPAWITRYRTSFSFVGLAVGAVFFAASLTPSLLPRTYATQGALSGLALAVGYAVGVLTVLLWLYLELPPPSARLDRLSRWLTSGGVALVVVFSLWRATVWQNSLRGLMEMEPLETAYPFRVALIAVVVAAVLVAASRVLSRGASLVAGQVSRVLPPRISRALGVLVVGFVTVSLGPDDTARLKELFADVHPHP